MTCVWEPDLACLGEEWEGFSPEVQDRALMLATSTLQMLTYYRVGLCPITIRPVTSRVGKPCGCWAPMLWDGAWVNRACAHDPRYSPIASLAEFDLPGPVGFIDKIMSNGVEQDLDNFRLHDGYRLVWVGSGPSPFLETQDLRKDDTEVGTWSITYSRSHAVGPDGAIAVAGLALEFARGCKPKGKCSLPKGVRTVSRNGVAFTIEAGLFPNGLTSIETVDDYILKWAPAGSPTQAAVVFNPREARARVTSGVPRRPAATPPVI